MNKFWRDLIRRYPSFVMRKVTVSDAGNNESYYQPGEGLGAR